jgi:hypothetical protein
VVLTASFITKTGRHDIAEILLKVVLDTINQIKSYHIKTVNGGVRVAQYLVFCAIFCRSLFIFCVVSFDHCIVCPLKSGPEWLNELDSWIT